MSAVTRLQRGRPWQALGGLPLLLIIAVVMLYPLACLLLQVAFPQVFSVHPGWTPSIAALRVFAPRTS